MLKLNEQQIEAINHNAGSMLVLSGPGSGKTTVISLRIKSLIENYNVNPQNILVVTYTKNSAEEMKNRFLNLVDNNINYKQVNFGTFHAHFFGIIRKYYNYPKNSNMSQNEKISLLKNVINEIQTEQKLELISDDFEIYDTSTQNNDNTPESDIYNELLLEISFIKNTLIAPKDFKSKILNSSDFLLVYSKYENEKKIHNRLDFDDMLIICYNLLKQNMMVRKYYINQFKYILIDEFQDINKLQYECIKLLLNKEKNLFVVGDDDQSIYSFRGSDPNILLNFSNDFPELKQVCLNVNYRCTDQVIKLSNDIIKENTKRFDKDIIGTNHEGINPKFIKTNTVYDEAEEIVKNIIELQKADNSLEIAVMYRTNYQTMYITDKLINSNISYTSNEKVSTIYDSMVAKDIIAYLKLSQDNSDIESFMRIIYRPFRYLNKILLSDILKSFDKKSYTSILDFALNKKDLEPWQYEKFEDLKFDILHIKTLDTYDAIEYIMNNIHYDEYLLQKSENNTRIYDNFKNMADRILETSKSHSNISDYIAHTQKVLKTINTTSNNGKNKNGNNLNKEVTLTTIHSSKGLEFDVVFILSCIEGVIPYERNCNSEFAIEEERRLLYVAMTRAKKQLNIGIIKSLKSSKTEDDIKHSRFLDNILK